MPQGPVSEGRRVEIQARDPPAIGPVPRKPAGTLEGHRYRLALERQLETVIRDPARAAHRERLPDHVAGDQPRTVEPDLERILGRQSQIQCPLQAGDPLPCPLGIPRREIEQDPRRLARSRDLAAGGETAAGLGRQAGKVGGFQIEAHIQRLVDLSRDLQGAGTGCRIQPLDPDGLPDQDDRTGGDDGITAHDALEPLDGGDQVRPRRLERPSARQSATEIAGPRGGKGARIQTCGVQAGIPGDHGIPADRAKTGDTPVERVERQGLDPGLATVAPTTEAQLGRRQTGADRAGGQIVFEPVQSARARELKRESILEPLHQDNRIEILAVQAQRPAQAGRPGHLALAEQLAVEQGELHGVDARSRIRARTIQIQRQRRNVRTLCSEREDIVKGIEGTRDIERPAG